MIREAAERIRALGHFAASSVDTREGSSPDRVVVEVDVTEQNTGEISFGANYNSDNGIASGYTYFNVRGITQTRLNVTLDGVPLQDPEDQALYFSNFGDFASAVDSIQVQRGVGISMTRT